MDRKYPRAFVPLSIFMRVQVPVVLSYLYSILPKSISVPSFSLHMFMLTLAYFT